ncbi:hypothetical protein Peur_060757 [Populus x canadensis]
MVKQMINVVSRQSKAKESRLLCTRFIGNNPAKGWVICSSMLTTSQSNATKGEKLAILQLRKNESSRKRSKDVSHETSD